jgi:hypothetical protein
MDANSDSLYRQLVQSVGDYAIFALDGKGCVMSCRCSSSRHS